MTWLLAVLSGLLMSVSMPTQWGFTIFPDVGYLIVVAFVPLYMALESADSWRRVFSLSLVTLILFFTGTLFWLYVALNTYGHLSSEISIGLLVLVILILAIWFAATITLAVGVSSVTRLPFWVIVAVFWTAMEWARIYVPFNGFPWGHVAMALSFRPDWIQSVQWIGTTGLIALIFLINGLCFLFLKALSRRSFLRAGFLGVMVAIVLQGNITWGRLVMLDWREQMSVWPSVRVALVQANIAQDQKWNEQMANNHLDRHRRLSEKAFASSDLIIWPEASYPFTIDRNQSTLMMYNDHSKVSPDHLIGAITHDSESDIFYNSVILVDGQYGNIVGRYDKSHLVPFGEYVPFRDWLVFAKKLTDIVGEFREGAWQMPIVTEKAVIGPLICYEDIFPDIARTMTARGANLLVNVTNDAWYGWTSAARQHLGLSVFRTIENRRYLVRATNTGISAVIDPTGKVVLASPMFDTSLMQSTVTLNEQLTPYVHYGDFIGKYSCIFMGILLVFAGILRKARGYAQ